VLTTELSIPLRFARLLWRSNHPDGVAIKTDDFVIPSPSVVRSPKTRDIVTERFTSERSMKTMPFNWQALSELTETNNRSIKNIENELQRNFLGVV